MKIKKQTVSFTINIDTKKKLYEYAVKNHINKSIFVEDLILNELNKIK